MCNPAAAIQGAVAVISIIQQDEAADRTNAWNDWQAGQAREAANRAAQARYRALAARRKEQRENAVREVEAISRDALRAGGITRLAGAGESVGAVLTNIAAQAVSGGGTLRRREEFRDIGEAIETEATFEQNRGRILASQRAPAYSPGLFSLNSLLRVGVASYTGYLQGETLSRPSDVVSGQGATTPRVQGVQPTRGGLAVQPGYGSGPFLSDGSFYSSSV